MGLWDTAGQEDYDRLRPLSYPNTDVFLVCFSLASRTSMENVRTKWVPEIRHHCPASTPMIIVGTKADSERCVVAEREAREMARDVGGEGYFRTSALRGEGLKELFEGALEMAAGDKGKARRKERKKVREATADPQPPEMPDGVHAPAIGVLTSTFAEDVARMPRDLADVELVTDSDGKGCLPIRAHRVVLCSASSLFRRLLVTDWARLSASARPAETQTPPNVTRAAPPAAPAAAGAPPQRDVPQEFQDPISLELMVDPVIALDGMTYDRATIARWFETHDTSPMSGAVLEAKTIIPNHNLRSQIRAFCEKAGIVQPQVAAPAVVGAGGVASPSVQRRRTDYGCPAILPMEPRADVVRIVVSGDVVSRGALEKVVEFLYSGLPSSLSRSLCGAVQSAAEMLELPRLAQICQNVLDGTDDLNPSIGTFVNDEVGQQAKDLFLGKSLFSDVSFVVGGTFIPAHRAVLSCRSPALYRMLTCSNAPVEITGVTPACFLALLEYAYSDHSPIESVDRVELLKLAHRFEQPRLLSLCELYTSKLVDEATRSSIAKSSLDICGLLETSQSCNAQQLSAFLMHFCCTNYGPITQRPEFSHLSKTNRDAVERDQWPPKSYLLQVAEYNRQMNRLHPKSHPAPGVAGSSGGDCTVQ